MVLFVCIRSLFLCFEPLFYSGEGGNSIHGFEKHKKQPTMREREGEREKTHRKKWKKATAVAPVVVPTVVMMVLVLVMMVGEWWYGGGDGGVC